jgi:hypothetical protein
MKLRTALFAAALAVASSPLFAQPHGLDCSQAKDPRVCEERVAKMKAARAEAEKACQGKAGQERSECMTKHMCAQASDPKSCLERAARMRDARSARQDARATCRGKAGAEHEQCMAKETCSRAQDPAKCEADSKERMARRHKIHEACKDKRGEELKSCIRDQRSQK